MKIRPVPYLWTSLRLSGVLVLMGALAVHADPPPNDDFANSIPLSGAVISTTGTNREATSEPGEPNHAYGGRGKSIWWRWIAPLACNVRLSTAGSGFMPALAVYQGEKVDSLTWITHNLNGDDVDHTSEAYLSANQGDVLMIAVDSLEEGTVGDIILQLEARPANEPVIWRVTNSKWVEIGQSAMFCTLAAGVDLKYQWRWEDKDLPGETNGCMQLASIAVSQSGHYSVRVSNDFGSVVSKTVELRVLDLREMGHWPTRREGEAHAVDVADGVAYAACGPAGLQVYDISNPGSVVWLGEYRTCGYAVDVQVVGTLAYLADDCAGVTVLDVSNPGRIVQLGSFHLMSEVHGLRIVGARAYIAAGWSGLKVLDVGVPEAIVELGSLSTLGDARQVQVIGDLAYVANGTSGLQVLDVSSPGAMSRVGGYDTPGEAGAVDVVRNFAYVADGGAGLQLLDVQDPSAIVSLGSYDTPDWAMDVRVVGDTAFVADGWRLHALSVGEPTSITSIGSFEFRGRGVNLKVQDDKMYSAEMWGGVQIIDISNPRAMIRMGAAEDVCSFHADVEVKDGTAYLADYYAGKVSAIDVSNAGDLIELSTALTGPSPNSIQLVNQRAYVALRSGISVLDVSDPSRVMEVGHFNSGDTCAVFVTNGIAYAANGWRGLDLFDVSDDRMGLRLGGAPTEGYAWGISVLDGHAYLAAGQAGLEVFNVVTPANVHRVARIDTPGYAEDVQVSEGRAYVADGYGGIQIIDVSEPTAPRSLGQSAGYGWVLEVQTVGTVAYAALGRSGVAFLDVSDPRAVVLLGTKTFNADVQSLWSSENRLYLAAASMGLRILDLGPPAGPPILVAEPEDQTTVVGATVRLAVKANGGPTFSYQWFRDGVPVPDETNAFLVFQPITPEHQGAYSVVVENQFGSAASRQANLTVLVPPPNDLFSRAEVLTGIEVSITASNVNASKEPGEPDHFGFPGGKSVWWTWTAHASAPVEVSTRGSSFDTVSVVYSGTSLASLWPLAGNHATIDPTRTLSFQAVEGSTYVIAVDGIGGQSGNIHLSITQLLPPSNDNFSAATLIPTAGGGLAGSNVRATEETREPYHAGQWGGHSVWWRWQPSVNASVRVTTLGSTFDTLLGVYTGNSVASLFVVAANDNSKGTWSSECQFHALAGVDYFIAVDGKWGVTGDIALQLETVEGDTPVIWVPPVSVSRMAGSAARFSVNATGAPPLSFQWRKGGVDLPGKTSASLELPATVMADTGDYSVLVFNSHGQSRSEAAALVVMPLHLPVTQPGDPVVPSSVNSPGSESAANAIDDKPTKYLNFDTRIDGKPSGFVVAPSVGITTIAGITLQSANDAPERDPRVLTIEGSNNDTITDFASGDWQLIARLDDIPAFTARFQTQEFFFANSTAYRHYRITVHATQIPNTCCFQIAEVELLTPLGVADCSKARFLVQPEDVAVLAGAQATFHATVNGPWPLQWYRNSTPIPGAHATAYTTDPVTAANAADVYSVEIVGCERSVGVKAVLFTPSSTKSIGVSFQGGGANGAPTLMRSNDIAGIFPQAHWNNAANLGTGSFPYDTTDPGTGMFIHNELLDSDGMVTTVTFNWATSGTWGSGTGTDTATHRLLNGVNYANSDSDPATITFGNVPPGNHAVIAYLVGVPLQFQNADYRIVGSTSETVYVRVMNSDEFNAAPGFYRGASTKPQHRDLATFVRFDNVSPASDGTIRLEWLLKTAGFDRGVPVNAVQLVLDPPPPGAPPAITVQPRPTFGPSGGTGLLSVSASGESLTYQWRKHGRNLPEGGNVQGTRSPNLIIRNLSAQDEGIYSVAVFNPDGSVVSANAAFRLSCYDIQEELVGYWPFDELSGSSAANQVAGGAAGAVVGPPDWTSGQVGNAVSFTGQNYVMVSDYAKTSGELGVSFWVKPGAITALSVILVRNGWGELQTSTALGQAPSGQFEIGLEADALGGMRTLAGAVTVGPNIVRTRAPSAFPLTGWHHVALSADGAQLRLFVDGVEVAVADYLGSISAATAPELSIGAQLDTNSLAEVVADPIAPKHYIGQLDELALWNRPLTFDEIGKLHQAGLNEVRLTAVTVDPPTLGPPTILQEPANVDIIRGQDAYLEVVALGNPSPTYQWYFGDEPIEGGDDPILPLSKVQESQAGLYHVSMRNPFGVITSQTVTVTVALPTGFEADVTPRPDGNNNGTVTVTDWVQVGRFVAALDTAAAGSEFQRADCAPRDTFGNGQLTVSDWVQAGRYAAALDAIAPAAGPTSVSALMLNTTALAAGTLSRMSAVSGVSTAVRLVPCPTEADGYRVVIDAVGNENAIGFSLAFDPRACRFKDARVSAGINDASVHINDRHAALGQVGFALALPTAQTLAAGPTELLVLDFERVSTSQNTGESSLNLRFVDRPVIREIASADARVLPSVFQDNASWASEDPDSASRPALEVRIDSHQLTLAWPPGQASFVLEYTDDLTRPHWQRVDAVPQSGASRQSVNLPIGARSRFYRLRGTK